MLKRIAYINRQNVARLSYLRILSMLRMLRLCSILLVIGVAGVARAQMHEENIPKINTVEEAIEYANKYREVSVEIVNSERDVFLFDHVDLDNLSASVGKINTLYQRRTKFLKDTMITMVNVQTIDFNNQLIDIDSANALIDLIMKDYKNGSSYWDLMKKYQSASCRFDSGPVATEALEKRYGSTLTERKKDEIFKWSYPNRPNLPVIIIIHEEAHPVPAFYAISYTVLR